jgi:hypothetical protein
LAPSDFCLFGYIKHCLRGQSFEAADDLFSVIENIEQSISDAVFLKWMERLRRCIATNGEYLEEAYKSIAGEIVFIG